MEAPVVSKVPNLPSKPQSSVDGSYEAVEGKP